jgi:arsenate reductase
MAEGLVNHYQADEWQAVSAGTDPAGYVHPLAIEVMAELGVDISGQTSKSAEGFRSADLDLVITVCDDAAENCPIWLGPGRKLHIGFEDPAAATGSKSERLAVFRQVRDEIREEVLNALDSDTLPREQVESIRRRMR